MGGLCALALVVGERTVAGALGPVLYGAEDKHACTIAKKAEAYFIPSSATGLLLEVEAVHTLFKSIT